MVRGSDLAAFLPGVDKNERYHIAVAQVEENIPALAPEDEQEFERRLKIQDRALVSDEDMDAFFRRLEV